MRIRTTIAATAAAIAIAATAPAATATPTAPAPQPVPVYSVFAKGIPWTTAPVNHETPPDLDDPHTVVPMAPDLGFSCAEDNLAAYDTYVDYVAAAGATARALGSANGDAIADAANRVTAAYAAADIAAFRAAGRDFAVLHRDMPRLNTGRLWAAVSDDELVTFYQGKTPATARHLKTVPANRPVDDPRGNIIADSHAHLCHPDAH